MRIFHKTNFNFIKWRWHALVLSTIVIVGGLVGIYSTGGMPLGIDFTGGTVVVAEFPAQVEVESVRAALDPVAKNKIVQKYGKEAGKNQIMIRLPLEQNIVESGANLEEGARKVEAALTAANLQPVIIDKQIVGPQIGADLQSKGIWATLTALAGILIYITFRFRFSFALGAIVATFHDILVTLVALWAFGYDLSLNVIAAILTIAGYSVNDTIVVFDRVREDMRTMRKEPMDVIVNKAVNETLGRTVITAGTTFLAVLALFLFGGEVLRSFAFTMLVGIITGTYSTVFIAAAIAIILSQRAAPAGPASKRGRV